MRESIGTTWLFIIVITFILLFSGVMALTINHSKALAVKDEIINIIENANVQNVDNKCDFMLSKKVRQIINNYIQDVGYFTIGSCEDGWCGYDREGNPNGEKASYCVRMIDVPGNNTTNKNAFPTMVYYDVKVFYQLDIPFLNQIFNFPLKGSTKILYG